MSAVAENEQDVLSKQQDEELVAPVVSALSLEEEEESPEDCPPCKSGAPAWMATFADMATLLMAFFVLLLSFSDTEVPKFDQINGSIKAAFGIRKIVPTISIPGARSIIVEEFTPAIAQRSIASKQTQFGKNINAENVIVKNNTKSADFDIQDELRKVESALADAVLAGEIRVSARDDNIVVEVSTQMSASSGAAANAGQISQRLIDLSVAVLSVQTEVTSEIKVMIMAEPLTTPTGIESPDQNAGSMAQDSQRAEDRLSQLRAELNTEIQQGLVEVERQGLAIVIRLANQGSFISGSADLTPSFLPVLTSVGLIVNDSAGLIKVQGHTDNIPIVLSERFVSNWDLSALRAASVAEYFSIQLNVDTERMRVNGFADTVPIDSNATAEGRARNRRIEIIIDG